MNRPFFFAADRRVRSFFAIAALATLCATASGCVVEERRDPYDYGYGRPLFNNSPTGSCGSPLASLASATIDPTMVIDPKSIQDPSTGQNLAGAYVEYAPGGHWRVWTSCDTATSGQSCGWSITAQTLDGSAIANAQAEALEPNDNAYVACGNEAILDAVTSTDTDGVTFDATPGVGVQIYVYLEGQLDPRMINWIDNGVARQGAPTDPVDIVPSSP